MTTPLSRSTKLQQLSTYVKNDIPDKYLDELYNLYVVDQKEKQQNDSSKTVVAKGKKKENIVYFDDRENVIDICDVVDKKKENDYTTKKNILLKIINKILKNIGRNEIDDICKFKGVKRTDITQQTNVNNLFGMEEEIFQVFDKHDSGWYIKDKKKEYVFTFIRYACGELNLKLKYDYKTISNNSKISRIMFYSISP